MDTKDAAGSSEEVEAELARLRAEVARLAAQLGGGPGDGRHRVEDLARDLERRIEEKPVQAALIALFAGVVIGLLSRR